MTYQNFSLLAALERPLEISDAPRVRVEAAVRTAVVCAFRMPLAAVHGVFNPVLANFAATAATAPLPRASLIRSARPSWSFEGEIGS